MCDNGMCCGHEHYGDRELWLSVDDMTDLVRAVTWETVREILSGSRADVDRGPRPLTDAERARIRDRFGQMRDERGQDHDHDEPEPGRRHLAEARRERRWGGR